MSLESAIEANTAAINRLVEAMGKQAAAPKEAAAPAQAPKPTPAKPATVAPAAPAKTPAAKTATEAAAVTYTYPDVSKATIDLASAKGRGAAMAVLAKYGAKNAKEVKPEQYADYMADIIGTMQA